MRRKSIGARLSFLALVAFMAAGCFAHATMPPESQATRDKFVAAVQGADPGTVVDFGEALPGNWNRVAVLPAYTSDQDARELLGTDFHAEGSPAYVQDDLTTVALFDNDHLVDWFAVSSDDVDMSSIPSPIVVSKPDARFRVEIVDGRLTLAAPG